MLTLGQLAEGGRGGGSVLLYSSELRKQNMTAVNPKKASILESWGNGTNTEVRNELSAAAIADLVCPVVHSCGCEVLLFSMPDCACAITC